MTREAELSNLVKALELNDRGFVDDLEVYEALKPFVTEAEYRTLGAMMEYCPIHICDIRICADDGLHGDEVYNDPPTKAAETGTG